MTVVLKVLLSAMLCFTHKDTPCSFHGSNLYIFIVLFSLVITVLCFNEFQFFYRKLSHEEYSLFTYYIHVFKNFFFDVTVFTSACLPW